MDNEGLHLRDTQRGDEAIAMWDQLFSRFAADPPDSDPFVPVRGQPAKSRYLAETGRLDAAPVTCDRTLQECSRLDLPEACAAEIKRAAHGCVAVARRPKGSPDGSERSAGAAEKDCGWIEFCPLAGTCRVRSALSIETQNERALKCPDRVPDRPVVDP